MELSFKAWMCGGRQGHKLEYVYCRLKNFKEDHTFAVVFAQLFHSSANAFSAGIFKQSMGARNRVGIVLSYWPARLHRLAKLVPWNRFLGSLKV